MENTENKTNNAIALIKVVGIGGGGNNTVNQMLEAGVQGAEFIVLNTDAQVVAKSLAEKKIVLGKELTKGLGAGGNPEIGRQATLESEQEIRNVLQDADLVFVAAGLGGGTGTGSAPIVAKMAREAGALVVGIVTTPFLFEGATRNANAKKGYEELFKVVDALISISNDRLLKVVGSLPLKDSFREADNILRQSVQTITDLIAVPALINLDFADVKSVLEKGGRCLIGIGISKGEQKAAEAAKRAVNSPLLETSLDGAQHAIVNVTGGDTMTLNDVNIVLEVLNEQAGNEMNVKIGAAINDKLDDEVIVTIIASGYGASEISAKPTVSRTPKPSAEPVQPTPQVTTPPQPPQPEPTTKKQVHQPAPQNVANQEENPYHAEYPHSQREFQKNKHDLEITNSYSDLDLSDNFRKIAETLTDLKKVDLESEKAPRNNPDTEELDDDIPSFLKER